MTSLKVDYDYNDESDADDEYARSGNSPSGQATDYDTSPTDSNPPSNQQTPTNFTQSTNAHPSPRGNITTWTAEQSADYIATLGPDFERYADSFAEEEVNGEALIAIQHDELKEMGIQSLGHRLTILKNVYDIKVKQNVTIEPDHYIPLSADANAPDAQATQHDIARIIHQIKLRDEKLQSAEAELRSMKEDLNKVWEDSRRLREDLLPVLRLVKERQPLPTPDSTQDSLPSPHGSVHPNLPQSLEMPLNNGTGASRTQEGLSRSLSRKFSTKKLFPNNSSKLPSPTIHEGSPLDPVGPMSFSGHALQSRLDSSQPSPTSPPYSTTAHVGSRPFPPRLEGRGDMDANTGGWNYPTNTTDSHARERNVLGAPPPPRRAAPTTAPPQFPPLNSVSSYHSLQSQPLDSSTMNQLDGAFGNLGFSSPPAEYSASARTSTYIPTPTTAISNSSATYPLTATPSVNAHLPPLHQLQTYPSSTFSSYQQQQQQQNAQSHQQALQHQQQQQQLAQPQSPTTDFPPMKSFRVNHEEPCWKVLPIALKKYKIDDDWRLYSLYIVHGDQERCLGLEEKPLILFKQLTVEGHKPMFMLRRHAAPVEGFVSRRAENGALAGGLL